MKNWGKPRADKHRECEKPETQGPPCPHPVPTLCCWLARAPVPPSPEGVTRATSRPRIRPGSSSDPATLKGQASRHRASRLSVDSTLLSCSAPDLLFILGYCVISILITELKSVMIIHHSLQDFSGRPAFVFVLVCFPCEGFLRSLLSLDCPFLFPSESVSTSCGLHLSSLCALGGLGALASWSLGLSPFSLLPAGCVVALRLRAGCSHCLERRPPPPHHDPLLFTSFRSLLK